MKTKSLLKKIKPDEQIVLTIVSEQEIKTFVGSAFGAYVQTCYCQKVIELATGPDFINEKRLNIKTTEKGCYRCVTTS